MEDEPNEPREDESPFEIRPVFSEMEAEKEKEAEAEEEVELPKTPQEEQLGYNSMVWAEALFKRFIDAISGRGGVEAITGYADQIDFIELLTPLRQRMKNNDMFFQTALSKCNKDLLKRPLLIREDESYDILGFACENCGKQLLNRKSFCGCGGRSRPLAVKVFRKLRAEGLRKITPETVLMDVGYDRLADAYCDAFNAFRLVTMKTAELFGWEDRFRIENPELLNYMDHYFLGRLPGESKIPREEKEVLQFLVRGNIVLIPLPTAFNLIRQGIAVVKYGYMFEVLGCTGADLRYRELAATFGDAYDAVNKTIRKELYADREERKRTKTSVNKVVDGIYAPCMLMPRHFWENGTIANQVILEPVFKLPVHPKADDGSLQMLYAPIGGGKTFLLSSIVTYGVDIKRELVFNVLGDKSNSFMLSCLPMFGYNARTNAFVKRLDEELGVQPHGIPTLNLTFLRKDEKVPNEKTTNPPTKYDRIIRIDDPHDFEVPFDLIMAEFKKIVKDFDYTKAVGIINVRNLDRVIRLGTKDSENIDVQVAINILTKFDGWRKGDLTQSMRLLIDEMSYVAPSQVMLYAGDASRSGATISDFLKESRRDNVSLDGATQRPLEIITDIRDSSTNVFFRELPASKAKDKSQIDFILESILLYDPSVRPIVRDINNRGLLSKGHYWFWWNKQTRSINVIRPSPPTFCMLPETQVITDVGLKEVGSILVGDRVLTHFGRFKPVTKVLRRTYDGSLIKIKARFSPDVISLTPEHPVLTETGWKNAKDLKKGDRVALPILTQTNDVKSIFLSSYVDYPILKRNGFIIKDDYRLNEFKGNGALDEIKISPDFMRLVGYYLAEGHLRYNPENWVYRVCFTFNKSEADYVSDVCKLSLSLFGVEAISGTYGPVTRISISSRPVCKFFKTLFGTGASKKKIPSWMLYLPEAKQSELVKGFWRGDGNIERSTFVLATTSEALASQLRLILLRLGIIGSLHRDRKLGRKLYKGRYIEQKHKVYKIHMGGKSLEKASNILGVHHPFFDKRKNSYHYCTLTPDFVFFPVKSIETTEYSGLVYNLEVEEDNTYVTSAMIVHNCLQDPKRTTAQIIKMYEKDSGEQVLLGSWDEVPTLTHAASDAHKEKVGAIPI